MPKQQKHLSKIASATVGASLLGKGTNSTYFAAGQLNDSKIEPFEHMPFDFFVVGIRDLEPFDVNWLLRLKSNFMHEGVCSAKVKLILADSLLIGQQYF